MYIFVRRLILFMYSGLNGPNSHPERLPTLRMSNSQRTTKILILQLLPMSLQLVPNLMVLPTMRSIPRMMMSMLGRMRSMREIIVKTTVSWIRKFQEKKTAALQSTNKLRRLANCPLYCSALDLKIFCRLVVYQSVMRHANLR